MAITDYRQVEYIKNASPYINQKIQTDIIPSTSTITLCDCKFNMVAPAKDDPDFNRYLIFGQQDYTNYSANLTVNADDRWKMNCDFWYGGDRITLTDVPYNDRSIIQLMNGQFKYGNVSRNVYGGNALGSTGIQFNLSFSYGDMYLYGAKIYNGQISDVALEHDLVPAERISDGVLGLYDKITDEFYTRVDQPGTDFEKGPYVIDREIDLLGQLFQGYYTTSSQRCYRTESSSTSVIGTEIFCGRVDQIRIQATTSQSKTLQANIALCNGNICVAASGNQPIGTLYTPPTGTVFNGIFVQLSYTDSSNISSSQITQLKAEYSGDINLFPLPTEYLPSEYLCSTGTQVINTNITVNYQDQIMLDVKFGNSQRSYTKWDNLIFCGVSDGSGIMYGITQRTSSSSNNDDVGFLVGSLGESSNVISNTAVVNRNLLTIRRTNPAWGASVATLNQSVTLPQSIKGISIFGIRLSDTQEIPDRFDVYQRRNMYLYSARVIDSNGELVAYFKPAIRKSDSVAGLYDCVNDVFYTNAGTGSFSVNPMWYFDADGDLSNSYFIDYSEEAISEPIPEAMWRIDGGSEDGLPYNRLMITATGERFANWYITEDGELWNTFFIEAPSMSSNVYIGSKKVHRIYVGSKRVSRVYLNGKHFDL